MKIYCLKLDGFSYRRKVNAIRRKIQGKLVRQVGGCCTIETMAQMLTGRNSSELSPHGIGYTSWMDACVDPSKAVGRVTERPLEALPDWAWLKDTLPFITGWRLEAINPTTLDGCFGYLRHPQVYTSIRIENDLRKQRDYIKEIQSRDEDALYVWNYSQAHEACSLASNQQDMWMKQEEAFAYFMRVLEFWDFDEPDTLFWVFSDHGHWRFPELGGYPHPHNFVAWAVIRDNRDCPVSLNSDFIAASDFYYYARRLEPSNEYFLTEDCRMLIDTKKSTTAILCKMEPSLFKTLIYHEPDDRFVQWNYERQGVDIAPSECSVQPEKELKQIMRQHFDWVS